jgi:hypothetical protein
LVLSQVVVSIAVVVGLFTFTSLEHKSLVIPENRSETPWRDCSLVWAYAISFVADGIMIGLEDDPGDSRPRTKLSLRFIERIFVTSILSADSIFDVPFELDRAMHPQRNSLCSQTSTTSVAEGFRNLHEIATAADSDSDVELFPRWRAATQEVETDTDPECSYACEMSLETMYIIFCVALVVGIILSAITNGSNISTLTRLLRVFLTYFAAAVIFVNTIELFTEGFRITIVVGALTSWLALRLLGNTTVDTSNDGSKSAVGYRRQELQSANLLYRIF